MDASHGSFTIVQSADAARQARRLLPCVDNLSLDPDLCLLEYGPEEDGGQ